MHPQTIQFIDSIADSANQNNTLDSAKTIVRQLRSNVSIAVQRGNINARAMLQSYHIATIRGEPVQSVLLPIDSISIAEAIQSISAQLIIVELILIILIPHLNLIQFDYYSNSILSLIDNIMRNSKLNYY